MFSNTGEVTNKSKQILLTAKSNAAQFHPSSFLKIVSEWKCLVLTDIKMTSREKTGTKRVEEMRLRLEKI